MTIELDLNEKDIPPETLAEIAIEDGEFLQKLLAGVNPRSQKAAVRSNCSQTLTLMAQKHPGVLLPHWNYFVDLLNCANGFSKYVALYVLSDLARVDPQCRIDTILDDFFGLLGDKSVIVACNTAAVSARIVLSRPELEPRITRKLLDFDLVQPGPKHKDLVAAYIIEAFRSYFDLAQDKDAIVGFVWKRQDCSSPKTCKLAKEFIKGLN